MDKKLYWFRYIERDIITATITQDDPTLKNPTQISHQQPVKEIPAVDEKSEQSSQMQYHPTQS